MWYNNTQNFGQRGRQEHLEMDVSQFKRRLTDDGKRCIEFHEDLTKTRGSGLNFKPRPTPPKMVEKPGPRCPVTLFELYISKRPEIVKNSGRFYLTPKTNIPSMQEEVWYREEQSLWFYERNRCRYKTFSIRSEIYQSLSQKDSGPEIEKVEDSGIDDYQTDWPHERKRPPKL